MNFVGIPELDMNGGLDWDSNGLGEALEKLDNHLGTDKAFTVPWILIELQKKDCVINMSNCCFRFLRYLQVITKMYQNV